MPGPHDIEVLTAQLPPGQRRTATALLDRDHAPTYNQVAEVLGLHVGTVYQHLRRLRASRPEVYEAVMALRRGQLEERHSEAEARAWDHSQRWHRRRFFNEWGYWPRYTPRPKDLAL